MGGCHWTAHVLAEAAKHAIDPLPHGFGLETAYLLIQFTLGGLVLDAVPRRGPRGAASLPSLPN